MLLALALLVVPAAPPSLVIAGVVASQSPLTALVDWKDGRVADGVGPADVTVLPENERFWIGQGLRRAQIRVSDRTRRFQEELDFDQSYLSAIRDMELDESSVDPAAHRLFVLTSFQSKSIPPTILPVPARLQMLRVQNPAVPVELHSIDLDENAEPHYDYHFESIEVIPEEQLVLVVGYAQVSPDAPPGLTLNLTRLLRLYRYGPVEPNGPDLLTLVDELLTAPVPVAQCVVEPPAMGQPPERSLIRPMEAKVHRIGDDLLAFVRVAMVGTSKPAPNALALCRIDPDPTPGQPHLQWFDQASHIFDPVYYGACSGLAVPVLSAGQLAALKNADLTIHSLEVVVDDSLVPPAHYLYLACGRYHQILEFEITDVVANGFSISGCDPVSPRRYDLSVPPPNVTGTQDSFSDDLYHVTASRDPVLDVDLLYVIGEQYLHIADRAAPQCIPPLGCGHPCPPARASFRQSFGGSGEATGQVMTEYVVLSHGGGGATVEGPREHFWTIAPSTTYPWSAFDMTDRMFVPTALPPDPLFQAYAPGGTDGALAVIDFDVPPPEAPWIAAYSLNFGGVVRYDLTLPSSFEEPAAFLQPDYSSYRPAVTGPQGAEIPHLTEQIELGQFHEAGPGGVTPLAGHDLRLFTPDGRGGALMWPLSNTPPHNPLAPTLISEDWGVDWVEADGAYSARVAFGRGVQVDRPYILLDLSRQVGADAADPRHVLLGRYWFAHEGEPAIWQVLTLDTAVADPCNKIRGNVFDIAISDNRQWALVACINGFFLVRLDDPLDPLGWSVWSLTYTTDVTPPPFVGQCSSLLGPGINLPKVEGVCFAGHSHVVVSLSVEPAGRAGALALFTFGDHGGLVGPVGTAPLLYADQNPKFFPGGLDQIPGTDFFTGGAVRAHQIDETHYRIYATSHDSGAVVEYELEYGSPSTLTHLSTWSDGTHFSETPDCRPYDVGHPDGVPVVLVSRFLQTVALLAATGFEVEQEP